MENPRHFIESLAPSLKMLAEMAKNCPHTSALPKHSTLIWFGDLIQADLSRLEKGLTSSPP